MNLKRNSTTYNLFSNIGEEKRNLTEFHINNCIKLLRLDNVNSIKFLTFNGEQELFDKMLNTIKDKNIKVENIDCSKNELTYIPFLPDIEFLSCFENKLCSLPKLPKTLKYLYCMNNQISELPELPEGLKHLLITGNKINDFSKLPSGLIKFSH